MKNYEYDKVEKVIEDYRNGEYKTHKNLNEPLEQLPEGYVFDEEESVKWNREKLEIENAKRKEAFIEHRNLSRANADERVSEDIIKAIIDDFDTTELVAKTIFGYASGEGHSSGMSEVLNYLYDILDVVKVIFKEHSFDEKRN